MRTCPLNIRTMIIIFPPSHDPWSDFSTDICWLLLETIASKKLATPFQCNSTPLFNTQIVDKPWESWDADAFSASLLLCVSCSDLRHMKESREKKIRISQFRKLPLLLLQTSLNVAMIDLCLQQSSKFNSCWEFLRAWINSSIRFASKSWDWT